MCVTILVGIFKFHFRWKKYKNDDDVIFAGGLYQTSMFPHIWRIWFVGRGISVTPQCFIYNGMLWHILSKLQLGYRTGNIAILIIFRLIVQPYSTFILD